MIGQPHKKDEAELAWSAIKRAATARVNYEAQVWRERRLNEELFKLWEEFQTALNDGKLLEIEGLNLLGPGEEA